IPDRIIGPDRSMGRNMSDPTHPVKLSKSPIFRGILRPCRPKRLRGAVSPTRGAPRGALQNGNSARSGHDPCQSAPESLRDSPIRRVGGRFGPTSAPSHAVPDTSAPSLLETDDEAALASLHHARDRLREQVARRIVGQRDVVDLLITCLFARGHALFVGVPGLGKTLLIGSLAQALHLEFSRIQFTP